MNILIVEDDDYKYKNMFKDLKEILQNKFEILQNGCNELDLNWKRVAKYIKTI